MSGKLTVRWLAKNEAQPNNYREKIMNILIDKIECARVLAWLSCGAASAVAAKLAVEKYPNCEVLYCDTLKFEHPDNSRFMLDVEKWIGKKITILKPNKYTDIFDVFDRTGWLVGVKGLDAQRSLKKCAQTISA